MTPKYTPPCPRVTVEPEGYSRAGDFEYAKEQGVRSKESGGYSRERDFEYAKEPTKTRRSVESTYRHLWGNLGSFFNV